MMGQLSMLPAHVPDALRRDAPRQLELNIPIIAADPQVILHLRAPSNDNATAETAVALSFEDDESAIVGARWAGVLHELYRGRDTAKRIARDFAVEPRTAKAWLGGQAPFAKYLVRLGRLYGPSLVLQILAADPHAHAPARVLSALDEIEHRLKSAAGMIAVLRGTGGL